MGKGTSQEPEQEQMTIHAETHVPADHPHDDDWTPRDVIDLAYVVCPVLIVFWGGYWGWKKLKASNRAKELDKKKFKDKGPKA